MMTMFMNQGGRIDMSDELKLGDEIFVLNDKKIYTVIVSQIRHIQKLINIKSNFQENYYHI